MDSQTSLHIDGLTDVGTRRHNNEDAWWVGQPGGGYVFMEPGDELLHVAVGGAPVLLLVSDGVGGSNAGEVASQMAVSLISNELGHKSGALLDPNSALETIRAALHNANAAVAAKAAEPGYDGMGATLSLLCFAGPDAVYWGQAGDSRIYVCRHGRLRQISRDHSPVGRMRQQGEITEAEARQHPLRNQIDQSLGDPSNSFSPDVGAENVQPGDVYLLCSDGLSDGLWDREIEQILATIQGPGGVRPAVRRLVAEAKQASGRDNITAVVALAEGRTPAGASLPQPALWRRLFPLRSGGRQKLP
ncbi:MAG: protein phosphatase 2C domain-containing protein [Opitutaceae bacterium]|nr:protein phosphatase 2C domain-containing protein [Opitutaceae bacterium]